MAQPFDRVKALGEIPSSHVRRLRFLPEADRSVVGTISCGVLFVMAFWSGPARQAFAELKRVLAAVDPTGRLELVVVDIDGCPDLCSLLEFSVQHGAGETAWVKHGTIVSTSRLGFHRPECFEPLTRQLLKECCTQRTDDNP